MKENIKQISNLIILLLTVITVIFLWTNIILTTFIILGLVIIMFIYNSKKDKIYFIAMAISGAIVESIMISTGAWVYSTQNLVNIPYWIPFCWGIGAIIMKDAYLVINKKLGK